MDYRPIMLLQTSYKIFMKVMATRLQKFLGRLIGDTQQGFVRGRQMQRSVQMMLSMLQRAEELADTDPNTAAGILLLDFRKAYDTMDRAYILAVLRKFGFSSEFVHLIAQLHDTTTVQFEVNGELSDPIRVVSGIRQGCPMAPLLFILGAELLGLAFSQDAELKGIQVSDQPEERRHIFSAFVDDSTVYLEDSNQLPRAMELVREFGRLSGLQVQPAKSKFIFLDKNEREATFHGIPVLPVGATTRYLGHQVGIADLLEVNWADRKRKLKRRMATAERVATSVPDRVELLNVVFLPLLLFTASAFQPSPETVKELVKMQKAFLWKGLVATDSTKHKVTPSLVHLPRQAGEMGLASIPVALKSQRVKHTMLWILSADDIYRTAWLAWLGVAQTREHWQDPWITPSPARRKAFPTRWTSQRIQMLRDVGELLAPQQKEKTQQNGTGMDAHET